MENLDTAHIERALETVVLLLKRGEADRAAWRLADAAGMLREQLTRHKFTALVGLDEPTGRGFTLPSPKSKAGRL